VFVICFLLPVLGFSATINVPADQPTIQDGINAAVNGDTVLVAPGTYVENIDFKGKAITVASEQGAGFTVIDGNQAGSVVTFQSGEDNYSVLEGFKLTNGAAYSGGGIYCENSSPTITNDIISWNLAYGTGFFGGGGGIYCDKSSLKIINNIINNNSSDPESGGGILCQYSQPAIENNIIYENYAFNSGGGICCHYSGPTTILNNIIYGNQTLTGGGIQIYHSSSTITNNTITDNLGVIAGGGIHCQRSDYSTITNTILWDNDAPTGSEIWIGDFYVPSTVTVSYSDVDGGQSSVYVYPTSILNWGSGMIDANPLFFNQANSDFHLQQDPCQPGINNPCVDTGDPSSSMIEGTTRTDGEQDKGVVDMGYHYPIVEDDILEVPTEYPTIQQAIEAAQIGDTVLVAPDSVNGGSYCENIDFLGKAITVKSVDGPQATSIDGGYPANPDFGSVVVFKNNEGLDSVLDGFTLTNGTGTLEWVNREGGGVYCVNSSPTITNCIITANTAFLGGGISYYQSNGHLQGSMVLANSATGGGGGIYYGASSPTVIGCHISENVVDGIACGGGGIAVSNFSSPTLTACQISCNLCSGLLSQGGGVLAGISTNAKLLACFINDNYADDMGGGVCVTTTGITMENCVIFDNQSGGDGGGIASLVAVPIATNCTIWGNSAANFVGSGGGIYFLDSPLAVVTNCIVWSNLPFSIGTEGSTYLPLFISYCDIEGGWLGTGNIDADPLLVDGDSTDFHMTYNSPCRNSGSNNTVILPPEDFEGDPRIAEGTVDMGADEFHRHLYFTGDATPGGYVEMKFVGDPGTAQVGLIIGFSIFDPPIHGAYGDWYMKPPMLLILGLGPIPSNGVYVLPGTLPSTPSGPYTVYFQAMIGMKLTNLCTMNVQ